MMDEAILLREETPKHVLVLSLNRPDKRNALSSSLIQALHQELLACAMNEAIRLVVLKRSGAHFCSGADLGEMKCAFKLSKEDNQLHALALAQLLHTLFHLPQPTIACIQGDAMGGALGLIAACDIAIATHQARFCLSEVKLGLMPAIISPYLMRAIGARRMKAWALTAATIDPHSAKMAGLIHDYYTEEDFPEAYEQLIGQLCRHGPLAMQATKTLIADLYHQPLTRHLSEQMAERLAHIRTSSESQEGLSAFLEKRPPCWE